MKKQVLNLMYLLFTFPLFLHAQVEKSNFDYSNSNELLKTEVINTSSESTSIIVDSLFDEERNIYELSLKNSSDKTSVVLQKKSENSTLLWEFSIEYLDGSLVEAEGITLINNNYISINYNKKTHCEAKESSLVYLNSEGEFQSYVAVK